MRATGIVRRIDELGRIVIPREIRRSLGIREGDSLEIFVDGKDTVCFRKYVVDLRNEVEYLKGQIEIASNLSYGDQAKAMTLLNEVKKLIKDEE